MKGLIRYILFLAVATLLLLLGAEAFLRIACGMPKGLFDFRAPQGAGLYPPNRTLRMALGVRPYTVQTNSLGFRGPEIQIPKPQGTTRIIALGDSITDGFYVDNPDTYPSRLEQALREAGVHAEVINAARGGASIDLEYAILRQFCIQLQPDLVLLTFVTNDIDDIRGLSRQQLISRDYYGNPLEQAAIESEALFLARTALGEFILDTSLKLRYPAYRGVKAHASAAESDTRYDIPGARDFDKNVEIFLEKHVHPHDGILGYDNLTPAHQETIANYLYALQHMRQYLQAQDIPLIFIYMPGYNQVHDPGASMALRDTLAAGCAQLDIPMFDLTPALQQGEKTETLHLAPLDYHLTPAGNRLLGQTVAQYLLQTSQVRGNLNPDQAEGKGPPLKGVPRSGGGCS